MTIQMQHDVDAYAVAAFLKHDVERDIAQHIKTAMDRQYG